MVLDVQYRGGYHDKCGVYLEYRGGFHDARGGYYQDIMIS